MTDIPYAAFQCKRQVISSLNIVGITNVSIISIFASFDVYRMCLQMATLIPANYDAWYICKNCHTLLKLYSVICSARSRQYHRSTFYKNVREWLYRCKDFCLYDSNRYETGAKLSWKYLTVLLTERMKSIKV